MKRRRFLSTALVGAAAHASQFLASDAVHVPIIDSHIHLFDIERPQGVPWPPKGSSIYKSALPGRYRKVAAPFGIVGAIEIECSPWPNDNWWVLDIAARDPVIVGTIGDLEPAAPEFGKRLERLHKNPLFRGIRYGNLWNRDLSKQISNAAFIDNLKQVAAAGLVLDTANPDPKLIHAVVRLSDRIPNLKIVIDHLPELAPPEDSAGRKELDADLRRLGQRPEVFAKISGIVRRVHGHVPLKLDFYRDRLDRIWEHFGADRLLYGSDWPNSDLWAQYGDVFRLAKEFISAKGSVAMENFYWKNSLRAYSWVKRDAGQNCSACV